MIKFIQVSCRETNKIDPRQAKAVLKHKPDIILFEYPQEKRIPDTIFNKYSPKNKPDKEVAKIVSVLKRTGRKYPWVLSDVKVFKNIQKLWNDGHQVYLYFIDAPYKITSYKLEDGNKDANPFPKTKKYHWWWEQMEKRERYMRKHLRWILNKHKGKNLKALVFVEKFHWLHIKNTLGTKNTR